MLTETDPPVTDHVTGGTHTAQTTNAYDADGNLTSVTVADTTGGDASRTTSYTFNAHDEMASKTDALGNKTTFTYDAYGNQVTQTDAAGNTTSYAYDADGHLLTVTLLGYTGDPANPSPATDLVEQSRAYDPDGRLASITDSMGRQTAYTYTDNGLVATRHQGLRRAELRAAVQHLRPGRKPDPARHQQRHHHHDIRGRRGEPDHVKHAGPGRT